MTSHGMWVEPLTPVIGGIIHGVDLSEPLADTTRLLGLPPYEGKAILDFLFEHIQMPELQCRFRWEPGSVAFWDNRCVQHRSIWDYFPEIRHGYRVTAIGERPVGIDHRERLAEPRRRAP